MGPHFSSFLLVAATLVSPQARPAPTPVPLLVVLQESGGSRDGLPVYTEHREAARYREVLTRGFSGRMLRLYRWTQQWLAAADGRRPEPAYLLLSSNQGGFPRFGFWLDDERKAGAGYVDLHRSQQLTGRFGAIDQIFPHELAHVIMRQLAGAPPRLPGGGGANQIHAIGVRTDPRLAFEEGFAEHMQILAVDDPDAAPETAVLASARKRIENVEARYEAYRRALTARWSPAPAPRVGFLFWFPQAEQTARYHLVKDNRFAHQIAIPSRLLDTNDPYAAYLVDSVVPGRADDPFKSTPRMLSTEGVVAALFWRWATSDELRSSYRAPGFYARFGTRPEDVGAIENAYLKIFAVLASRRPHDTGTFVAEYVATFADEAAIVERIARAVGLDLAAPRAAEIWLSHGRFTTGTSLFDQYRGLPRAHTFDLNAAGLVDLMSVEGMTRPAAEAILAGAPYGSLAALGAVPEMTTDLLERFEVMSRATEPTSGATPEDSVEELGIAGLLRPVLYRAALWLLLSALASAWLYSRVRTVSRLRLAVNGLTAASVGLLATWVFTVGLQVAATGIVGSLLAAALSSDAFSPFLPVWLCGLPAAAWQLARHRSPGTAARVLAAWALACLPAFVITRSMF